MKILVTGSSGKLGSALTKELKKTEHEVKLTSRRKPEDIGNFDWIYSDFLTGEGLEEAIMDVDVVIHAATSPMKNTKNVDVLALEKFLKRMGHVKHFIYPSIIGIEDIPFNYYKHKHKAEVLLKNGNIPYTIIRATQFHSFVENLLLSKPIFKRYFIPGDIKFQSVDTSEFAKYLIKLINEEPQGKIVEFAGPKIMTLREMAEQKIKINNEENKIFSFSMIGKLYKALLEGKNTNLSQTKGMITFEEYLKNKLNQ